MTNFKKVFWPEDEVVFNSEARREERRKKAEEKKTILGQLSNKLEPGSKWRKGKVSKLPKVVDTGIPCANCKIQGFPVPPEGVHEKLMFVGIFPGKDEEKAGHPFVGLSGQLLRDDLKRFGINVEEECWLTNIMKCRLSKTPTPEQMKVCGRFLLKEIDEVKPQLIVLLGEPPLKFFFNKKLSTNRGLVLQKGDYKFFVTFNPAHLTREREGSSDIKLWERDLKSIYNFYHGIKSELKGITKKHICRTIEEVKNELEELKKQERFTLDIETFAPGKKSEKNALDPWVVGHKVVLISFSYKVNGERIAFCVPLEHSDSPLDFSEVILLVKDFFKGVFKRKQKVVGQNIKFDLKVLSVRFGIDVEEVYFDTLLAHSMFGKRRGTSGLEKMSVDYLGMDSYKYDIKETRGSVMIPLEQWADMNMDDCIYTYELSDIFEADLKKDGQWDYFQSIMMPATSVLKRMEQRGMKVDIPYCTELKAETENNLNNLETKLTSYPQVKDKGYSLTSNTDLQKILYEEFHFISGRKTKTGLAVDKDEIERMYKETKHPFLDDLLNYKVLEKLQNTYIEPYLGKKGAIGHIKSDGRVHGTFNQHIASTGRLSSENPNLQNLPVRMGPIILRMFISDPGWKLILADYSQIELRCLASISKDPRMMEALISGLDIHRATAAWRFGVPYNEVTTDQRYEAKSTNFGIVYGMTKYGLAIQIGVTVDEAEESLNSYLDQFPKVKEYMDKKIWEYQTYGYVKTLFGRKIWIKGPDEEHNKRRAINGPIQGTANEINLIALTEMDKKIQENKYRFGPINTIHDSGIYETPEEDLELACQVIKSTMEGLQYDFMMGIPLKVDISTGYNLGEAKD